LKFEKRIAQALFDRSGNLVSSLPAVSWVGVREGEPRESGASKDEFWFVNLIDGKATPAEYKVNVFGGE
jgi:hypothetical protein